MKNVVKRANLDWARAERNREDLNRGRVVVSYHPDSTNDLFPNPLIYADVQSFHEQEEVPFLLVGTDGTEIAINRVVEFFIVEPTNEQIRNRQRMAAGLGRLAFRPGSVLST